MANSYLDNEIGIFKPKKRFLIPINKFHVPKKLFNEFKKTKYVFKINNDFPLVIKKCSKPRKKEGETWINEIIINSYNDLFNEGIAKCIECYDNNTLVGGLYGVHLGSCFFGESMFSEKNNTSKLCLLYLISILKNNNFKVLDSQFYNPHLIQFGAFEISDQEYQLILGKNIKKKSSFPNQFNIKKSQSILQLLIHKS